MIIKILILLILVIAVIVYAIIGNLDNLLRREIIDILQKERKSHTETNFVGIDQIIEKIKITRDASSNSWLENLLINNWVYSKRNIRRRCENASLIIESKENKDFFGIVPRNQEILATFDWNSESIYSWELVKPKKSILNGIMLGFWAWFYITGLVFLLLFLLEFISPWVSIALVGFVFIEYMKARQAINQIKDENGDLSQHAWFKLMHLDNIISKMGSGFITSAYLYLLTSPVLPINQYFSNYTSNKLIWIGLSIKNIIDALFFEITEVIGFDWINIEPSTIVGRIMLAVLNFLIAFSFVNIIIIGYKSQTDEIIPFTGTVKDCYSYISGNFLWERKLVCQGTLNKFEPPIEFESSEFDRTFREDSDNEGTKINPFF